MNLLQPRRSLRGVVRGMFSFVNERSFVRSFYADSLVETFIISSIGAVLLIRLFLGVTGYPQLAPGGLHIAHVLWGGALMLVSVLMLLSFVSRPAREIAAFLGGVGFGTFIDEVGKFVTQANDYFYQPTIAIIYVVFVLLFVAGKALAKSRDLSQRECLSQVLEIMKHGVHDGLLPQDRDRAVFLLARCDPEDPTVKNLAAVLAQMDNAAQREPGVLTRLRALPYTAYRWAIRQAWFAPVVVGLFLVQSVATLVENFALVHWTLGVGLWLAGSAAVVWPVAFFRRGLVFPWTWMAAALLVGVAIVTTWAVVMQARQVWSFVTLGTIVFPALSSALVVVGIGLLPHSRLAAYQMFQRAVLITVLLTQVYAFYEDQLLAVAALFINVIILLALRSMIGQELGRNQHVPDRIPVAMLP